MDSFKKCLINITKEAQKYFYLKKIKDNDMIVIDSSLNITILKHRSVDSSKNVKLVKNLTNEDVSINSSIIERSLYYKVFIPELNEGEYTYYVNDSSNNVLETGLLYYGKMNEVDSSIKEYKVENKVYVYERQ